MHEREEHGIQGWSGHVRLSVPVTGNVEWPAGFMSLQRGHGVGCHWCLPIHAGASELVLVQLSVDSSGPFLATTSGRLGMLWTVLPWSDLVLHCWDSCSGGMA